MVATRATEREGASEDGALQVSMQYVVTINFLQYSDHLAPQEDCGRDSEGDAMVVSLCLYLTS